MAVVVLVVPEPVQLGQRTRNIMSQTISIPTGVTASGSTAAVWNNLLIRQSVLNSDNPNYLRSFQINNGYLVLTKGSAIAGIPLSSIAPLLVALAPALTWPPIISIQPVSATVIAPATAAFSMASTSEIAQTFQWQLLTGSTWGDLANAGVYSGVTTTILAISDSTSLNGNQYRCVATNGSGSTNTNAGTLTVN